MAWLYNQSPQVKAPEVTDPSPAQQLPRDRTTHITQVLCPWGRQAEGPSPHRPPPQRSSRDCTGRKGKHTAMRKHIVLS